MNPEFKHVGGKDNAIVDMLLHARYDVEKDMVNDNENIGTNVYSTALTRLEKVCLVISLKKFSKELYEGEWIQIGKFLSSLKWERRLDR